ncbi:MAG TPA: hypothetical protein VEH29_10115 [Acidimicrobiales bacterium]|nr:hypothetical protein [Acidimicrobiales bacterium]
MTTASGSSITRAAPGHRTAWRLKLGGALSGIALLAAACGSASSSTTTTAAGAGSSTPKSGTIVVLVRTARIGTTLVLVDSKGFTLYTYALDKPGKIACTSAGCTSVWPPLLVPAGDRLSMTLRGIGTETRPGGAVQVTFDGSPLYTYKGDTKAGEDTGNGVGDFFVAKASSTASGSSTTTSTSSSGGGYGY